MMNRVINNTKNDEALMKLKITVKSRGLGHLSSNHQNINSRKRLQGKKHLSISFLTTSLEYQLFFLLPFREKQFF